MSRDPKLPIGPLVGDSGPGVFLESFPVKTPLMPFMKDFLGVTGNEIRERKTKTLYEI